MKLYTIKELSQQQKIAALKHYIGAKPKFHKGIYSSKSSYHTCGNCGATIQVICDYCYSCGYRVLWDSPRCLTGQGGDNGAT